MTGERWPATNLHPTSVADARAHIERLRSSRTTPAGILGRVRNGSYLDSQEFPPLRWAVPGIFPEGMGLLIGPPKVGKSWAALGVSLAVAAGGIALGGIDTGQPGPVLYLALEDGERRLQDRCRRLLLGEPIPRLFEYIAHRVTPLEVLPIMAAWLDRHPLGLVFLDTLGKVMPPAMAGESSYARDYRIAGGLKALTDDHPGSALVVVHHDRKATSDDFVDSVSGTHGLAGGADFVVVLDRKRNEAGGLLKVTGRDVPENEYAVDVDNGRWLLRDGSLADAHAAAATTRATTGLGEDAARVVAFVTGTPQGSSPSEVAAHLGWSTEKAGTYLVRLVEAGRLLRPRRGTYTPVESVESEESGPSSTPHTPHFQQGYTESGLW